MTIRATPAIFLAAWLAAAGVFAEHQVINPPGTDVGLPFSGGVSSGDLLFLSGAIGNQPGVAQVEGDPATQTANALANLERVLAAAGLERGHLVDITTYLSDARLYAGVGNVLRDRLGGGEGAAGGGAARSALEADIALPNAVVEIAAVAAGAGVTTRAVTPGGWPQPTSGYSWGMLAGDTLFIALQAGFDIATGQPASGIEAQTRKALDNVGAVLAAAEMGFGDLVACRVYLADGRDYEAMNQAYASVLTSAPPARATVRARMLNPAFQVGLQCTAVRGAQRSVVAAAGAAAGGRPFSPAIRAGDRLYLSGFVGRGDDGYPAGIEAQTGVVFERLGATLAAAGMTFADVESATVFLTDVRHYGAMNKVYAETMPSPPPARATVGTPLMSPDALVEIQMIASKPAPAAADPDHAADD